MAGGVKLFSEKLDAVADALDAVVDDDARVIICLGPPRCEGSASGDYPCPFCYVVQAGDERSVDEIMSAMNAGH